MEPPFPGAYWADPGKLLAGPYPAEYEPGRTLLNLQGLLRAGIRTVISLMEAREENAHPDGRSRYVSEVERIARSLGLPWDWCRYEIHDMSVPDEARMDQILDHIESSLSRGWPVYAHCWGGRGRTGIVVGAYLIRRGLATPEDFVEVISELRARPGEPSPETAQQIEFVRSYSRGRARP